MKQNLARFIFTLFILVISMGLIILVMTYGFEISYTPANQAVENKNTGADPILLKQSKVGDDIVPHVHQIWYDEDYDIIYEVVIQNE